MRRSPLGAPAGLYGQAAKTILGHPTQLHLPPSEAAMLSARDPLASQLVHDHRALIGIRSQRLRKALDPEVVVGHVVDHGPCNWA